MNALENIRSARRQTISAWFCTLLLLLSLASLIGGPTDHSEPLPWADSSAASGQPASGLMDSVFIENAGQVSDGILFYAASGNIAFTKDSVLLYTMEPAIGAGTRNGPMETGNSTPAGRLSGNVLGLSFVKSNDVAPRGINPASWESNYFLGNDPINWRTGISNYHGVVYENLWDGIDLVYSMKGGGIKYDFLVAPGADHSQIKLRVGGHETLSVTGDGELNIGLGAGDIVTDSGLDVFYADAPEEKVRAGFVLIDAATYSFSICDRDMSRAMIIDPLIYSTYLGGAGSDYGNDIAVDGGGNVFVVGHTNSVGFPTTLGAYETDYAADVHDIFVTKMSQSGDSLVYSTFLGDVSEDCGNAITVDGQGNAYITGYTSSIGFPTTPDALDRTYNGDTYDSFVTKIGSMGNTLVYSTFLGGDRVDIGNDITVDESGYVYVTGVTSPTPPPGPPESRSETRAGTFSFPTTPGAFTWGNGLSDIFVTKFSQSGSSLVYSTAFGTDDYEISNGIAIDRWGYAYITGYTRSANYPTTSGAVDRFYGGSLDAFVTKLAPTGRSLAYSTYLGGSSSEVGHSIAVNEWGNAYVTGYTNSLDFPTTHGAYDNSQNGWADVFVTSLDRYGGSLIYSTFIGGAGNEYGYSIALDRLGSAHVTGFTMSGDFPTTPGAFDTAYNGNTDAFVAKLSAQGHNLSYSTYLGGSSSDTATALAIDANGYTFVAGETSSLDFSTVSGAMDGTFNGQTDAFITKMDLADPMAVAGPDRWMNEDSNITFDGGGSTDNHGIVNYTWTFNDGMGNVTMYGERPKHYFAIPGNYAVSLTVSDSTGNRGTDQLILSVLDITGPVAVAGSDWVFDEDIIFTFNGSASSDNVDIVNYTWSFVYGTGQIVLYGAAPAFNFTRPGSYNVTLNVSDAAGNTDTDYILLTVNDITAPKARAGENQKIYKNTLTFFNGSASTDNVGIVNHTWMFNDGQGPVTLWGGITQSHLFSVEGVYPITLNVTDAAGHWNTDTILLTVLEIIKPVADAGPDRAVDELAVMTFDGSASTDNVGVVKWQWSFNDGVNDAMLLGVSPSWVFTVPGTYIVTLNASDAAGNWGADTQTITVHDVVAPVAVPGSNMITRQGDAVVLDGSGSWDSSGIMNYTWSFTHNGTAVVLHGPINTYRFWTPGAYPVNLTVEDASGTVGYGTMTVTVLPPAAESSAASDNHVWIFISILAVVILLFSLLIHLHGRKGAVQ
ncbi:MAG: SBBP repeat-containing protein [Candidatus Thermoplasmatota archaeon]|nr:PKD domain-containing protein [Euryarchaeota archaeon]MBU4032893.1 SBBP repeat-containing protein [Candidatus Thermoplasmatota archaeon]MBU4071943.1 SBBP repeat-containing protein [Candidatus Thermoplasmatota archaeon]MBU4143462.1 SBBP repeat-containing protein [Candidatus Thermoplasmatota archaeon]MBU4591447.1 SBBP repeat-containing protein [Candidatus Thermoplasmatota archaeon]